MPILDWRQLQHAVDQKQKGKTVDPNNPAYKDVDDELTKAAKWEQFKQEQDAIDAAGIQGRYQKLDEGAEEYRKYISDLIDEGSKNDFFGYGESRYDKRVPYEDWVQDPIDYRANAQSAASKFLNGLAKAVPYTATTFLDNTLGTVAGLLGLGIDALDFQGDSTKASSFINNPVSELMDKVRNWSDENLPNYRTTEETEDQDHWWRHLNANFFGDTLMKNLGFTFGTMLSGMAISKGMRAIQPKAMREAYKAAIAASVGGDKAAEAAFQKVLQGARQQSPKKIYDTFASLRDSYKRLDLANQLLAGMGGAVGESRVEAITAAQEFRDEALADLDMKQAQLKNTLIEEIAGNGAYITEEPIYDGFGNIIDKRRTLNQDGRIALQKGLAEIDKSLNKERAAIDTQANDVARRVFALNIPIVGMENALMFGRLFSGGYKHQARMKVRGRMGNYRGITKGENIARGVGKAASEGGEELLQKVASEGRKDIARQNMSAFHDGQYDKTAMQDVGDSILSMWNSMKDVVSDPASWQEFTVGLLTGAIVDPVTGGYRAAKNDRIESEKAAKIMNERASDPNFQNLYKGLVRHVKKENDKDADLASGDAFAWHSDNDEQILSDVMTWAKAGRLNDLEDMVDSFADVKLSDIPKIKADFIDETDPEFSSKSEKQLLKWLHNRSEDVKRTINQYRDFRESLDYMAMGTTDDDVLDEMTYTQAQLQNFERRYNTLLDSVLKKIRPTIENISRETDKQGNPTKRALQAQKLLSSEDNLRTIFGGAALDIEGRSHDSSNPVFKIPVLLDDQRQEAVLKTLEEWGAFSDKNDKSTKQEVKDLQKLVRSRQDFYARLFDPTFRQKFQEQKKDNVQSVEEVKRDAVKTTTDDMMAKLSPVKSMREFVEVYNSFGDLDDPTREELHKKISEDKNIAGYLDAALKGKQFVDDLIDDVKKDSGNIAGEDVREALNNLDVSDVLANMAEGTAPEVAIGQALLDSLTGNLPAQNLARQIMQNRLGDIAKENELGVIPEPETKEEEKADPKDISDYQNAEKAINSATRVNDSDIDNILKGDFSKWPNISGEEKLALINLAQKKYNALKEQVGDIADGNGEKVEVIDESLQTDGQPQEQSAKVTESIEGSHYSVYNIDELKQGRKVDHVDDNNGVNATLDWYRRHNVQVFVDSGALAALEKAYRAKGKRLPIYFLGNPHYVKDNLTLNPFVVEYSGHPEYQNVAPNILFAVEMNEENQEILADFIKAGVISNNTTVEVQEGNKTVRYQIIGQVYNPKDADVDTKREGNKMFDWAMTKSILPQYEKDVKASVALDRNGKWYVAKNNGERISTTLNYHMSGRNQTRDEKQKDYKKVPLSTSLKDYKANGGQYYFGIQTRNGFYTFGPETLPDDVIFAPQGSLWMATTQANGTRAWTYITIARTNEFDFNANKDTELVKEFDGLLSKIFAPVKPNMSQEEFSRDLAMRSQASKMLNDLIYLGVGNTFSIVYQNGQAGLYVAGDQCMNRDEVLNALKNGKYRFQINTDALADPSIMQKFIDAGVLTSEMQTFIRNGSSFGVNYLEEVKDKNGKVIGVRARQSESVNTNTPEGTSYRPGTVVIDNIRIGDSAYRLNGDGSVVVMGANGRSGARVTDKTIISQVKALNTVMSSTKETYPGNIYIVDIPNKQYTEMYEQEVDGVLVHIVKRGENGAFIPEDNDAEWNSLMVYANKLDRKPAAPKNEKSIPSTPEENQEKAPEQPKKRTPKTAKDLKLPDDFKSNAMTVQETQTGEMQEEDRIDCG